MCNLIHDISSLQVRYEVVKWPDRFQVVIRKVYKNADNVNVFDTYEDAMLKLIDIYNQWACQMRDKSSEASNKLKAYLCSVSYKKKNVRS